MSVPKGRGGIHRHGLRGLFDVVLQLGSVARLRSCHYWENKLSGTHSRFNNIQIQFICAHTNFDICFFSLSAFFRSFCPNFSETRF